MLKAVKESVHRMTSHLQLISGYLEMEDYGNALGKTKETIKELHALATSLTGLANVGMTVPKDSPHADRVIAEGCSSDGWHGIWECAHDWSRVNTLRTPRIRGRLVGLLGRSPLVKITVKELANPVLSQYCEAPPRAGLVAPRPHRATKLRRHANLRSTLSSGGKH